MAKRTFTEAEKQAIKNDYDNMSLRNLAKQHDSSVGAIRVVLSEMGVGVRGRGRPSRTTPKGGEIRLVNDNDTADLFDPDEELVTEDENDADRDFDSWN